MQQAQEITPQSNSNRSLWLAVGALGIAVAGLGGVLIGTQLPGSAAVQQQAGAAGFVPFDGPEPAVAKPAAARPAVAAPAKPSVSPAPARAVQVRAPAAVGCADCGTVVSVAAVQRAAQPVGIGAVAGGVVGGVLGNQIGGGSGRAVATVVGAVGGGWAGHEVEKRVRQTTAYAVRVRMDDGSMRTLEQSQPVSVGSPVRVQQGVARVQDRTVSWNG